VRSLDPVCAVKEPAILADRNHNKESLTYSKIDCREKGLSVSDTTARKKILVVDDDHELQAFLRRILSDYDVCEAPDGEKALEAAVKEPPDLILMDVRLPGMDGYQTTSQMRQQPSLAQVPVIFLSGQSAAEDKGRSFASGGSMYLRKPIRKSQLQQVLNLVFGGRDESPAARKEIAGEGR
jgi:CheY-like chemotaxis protein